MADETPLEAGAQPTPTIAAQQEPAPQAPTPALFTADNWRSELAGGDEKVLKALERYTDPKAAAKALYETKRMVSSGEYRKPLSKDASPEEINNWRKENGIPESPDKYEIKLASGLTVSDEEKPFIDEFLKAAHASNATPEMVNGILDWYYQLDDKRQEQQEQADTEFRQKAADTLRSEWGQDYRQNINLLNGLLAQAPEGFKENFLGARLADGSLLGDNPEAIKFMVGLAREINPIATVVPGAGANAGVAIGEELASIQKLMADHNSEYWKGPNSANLQARYDQLVAAQQRMR